MFTVASRAELVLCPPIIPTDADTNDDSLISVVEDFSPPPSPTPTSFTKKLDEDETFLKSSRSCLFELMVHPRDGADEFQR